jgi:hypoxia up-regulated 1
MSRSFPEKEFHIIYDAGASGIRATLASFHTAPSDPAPKALKSKTGDPTHVEVKGFGYDRLASGAEMDLRLRNILKEAFETKHARGRAINKEMRAIAKLNKEANRVKTILSANIESNVMVRQQNFTSYPIADSW